MFRKIALLLSVFFVFALNAEEKSNEKEFLERLYKQAAVLLVQANQECKTLPVKNRALMEAMAKVHKEAKERRNPATNIFADVDYLLGFLQERIEETCSQVALANNQTIALIISSEFDVLISARGQSADYETFIDKIFGTEYSKFLYLTTAVSNLEKIYVDWTTKMASDKSDMKKMAANISEANAKLRDDLVAFTKAYKFYYEKDNIK